MKKAAKSDLSEESKVNTKVVHNRNGYKIELVVNGAVVVLLPGKSVEVPIDYEVPLGIGLYVTVR